MNTNKQMVPELRFKGFTDAWEESKLGDLGDTYASLSGKSKADFGHGSAEYVTYMNVFTNPISDPEMTDSIELDASQHTVKRGDVFFTVSSETPEEVGMSSVWLSDKPNVYLNSFCFGYRPTIDIDAYFLSEVLRAPAVRSKMMILAQGISRYNISKNRVMQLSILLPSKREQEEIGRFLGSLNKALALHQRKLDLLKEQKKGYLQKLFPKNGSKFPQLRFAGFTDAWKKRKLGELNDVRDGTHDSPKYVVNGHPFVTSKNLSDQGLDLSDVSYISDEDFAAFNKRSKVDVGDILFGMIGTIGHPVLVESDSFAIKNVALIKGGGKISNCYLLQLLKSPVFDRYVKRENAGGTQKFLGLNLVRDFVLRVPNDDEQRKIGTFFAYLDNLIAVNQRKVELLKKLKQAYLQKMFL